MKIDFLSSYNELQRALQHHRRSEPPHHPREFAEQLENVKDLQNPAPVLPPSPQQSSGPSHSPLSRLGTLGVELLAPDPVIVDPKPSVNEPAPSVKTPRIVLLERQQGVPQPELARQVVDEVAPRVGIDPALGLAIAKAESSFNPHAVSSDGFESKGLFQLLDSTASTVIGREGLNLDFDPFNAQDSAEVGLRYLRYLHEVFSQPTDIGNGLSTIPAANSTSLEKLAVAAYNAGEGRVAAAQERAREQGKDPSIFDNIKSYLPEITQKYVDRVIRFRNENGGTMVDRTPA